MGLTGSLGVGIYYLGMLIMIISVVMLVGGVAHEVTAAMGKVQATASDPGAATSCAGGQCIPANTTMAYDNPFDIAMFPADALLGGWIDAYFEQMGLGQLQADPSVSGTMYAQIRHFFTHLGAGLLVMLVGMLLRVTDGFVGLVGGRGQKQKSQLVRMKLGTLASTRQMDDGD